MSRKVLFIDHEKCTGCRKCEMVCSVFHTGTIDPGRSRIRVMKWNHVGFYLPISCQNCERAYCTEVCPAGACSKDLNLQVAVIDRNVCIGCKSCILACPFGVPVFDQVEGNSIKCDYCNGDPQCVAFCEAGALDYVDIDKFNLKKRQEFSSKLIREYVKL